MNNKHSITPEDSARMVSELITNPQLGEIIRDASAMLLDSVDNGFFSGDIMKTDESLINIVKENFRDRDPIFEVRLYKTQNLIYAMLKKFQDLGIVTIIKPKTIEERMKDKALQIWVDYKKKKSVL